MRPFSRRIAASAALIERPARCDLRPVFDGDHHQALERAGRVDQRDLQVVLLERIDDRAGIEPEDLRQVGAADAPLLPR